MNDCALNCESAFADSIAVVAVAAFAVIADNGIAVCGRR